MFPFQDTVLGQGGGSIFSRAMTLCRQCFSMHVYHLYFHATRYRYIGRDVKRREHDESGQCTRLPMNTCFERLIL